MLDVRERLLANRAESAENTPDEFSAVMKSEATKWARVIKEANIRAE